MHIKHVFFIHTWFLNATVTLMSEMEKIHYNSRLYMSQPMNISKPLPAFPLYSRGSCYFTLSSYYVVEKSFQAEPLVQHCDEVLCFPDTYQCVNEVIEKSANFLNSPCNQSVTK